MSKLLQINITANWGSTGKIAEQTALCAMKLGWDCYTAYGRCANPSQTQLIRIGSKLDTYAHYGMQRLWDNEGMNSRWATRMFIKKIEQLNPDVIHLHNIHDHYMNYPLLFEYLNSCGKPLVWTMHDFWAVTGHCMHFTNAQCDRWQSGCHNCPMQKVYPNTFLDRSGRNYELKKQLFAAHPNMTLVGVSDWVGNTLTKSFLKDNPIMVIPNGIDVDAFRFSAGYKHPEIKDTDFVILGVSFVWGPEKGLDDYKRLSEQLGDGYKVVLVGVTDDIIRQLPKNIIGIKRTKDVREMVALYSRADVVTILSRAETFGLTAVEGYACGTPAIVYDNTALPALITPETGRVVKTGDIDQLCETVSEFKNSKFKQLHSTDCRHLAEAKYDKNKCFDRYVQLYEELLRK